MVSMLTPARLATVPIPMVSITVLLGAHLKVWSMVQSQDLYRMLLADFANDQPHFFIAFARHARPSHQRRAVLRPGVRVRGHAAVAHAARAPEPRRSPADGVPAAGRVVGVDV